MDDVIAGPGHNQPVGIKQKIEAEHSAIFERLAELEAKAKTVPSVIADDEQAGHVGDLLKAIRAALAMAESVRKIEREPYAKMVSEVNATFSIPSERLEKERDRAKMAHDAWLEKKKEAEKRRREEEAARQREAAERLAREAEEAENRRREAERARIEQERLAREAEERKVRELEAARAAEDRARKAREEEARLAQERKERQAREAEEAKAREIARREREAREAAEAEKRQVEAKKRQQEEDRRRRARDAEELELQRQAADRRAKEEAHLAQVRAVREQEEAQAKAARERAAAERETRDRAEREAAQAKAAEKVAARDEKGATRSWEQSEKRADRLDAAANASDADLSRTRGELGSVSSLARTWVCRVVDFAALSADDLWPFVTGDERAAALHRYMKAGGRSTPGAVIEQVTSGRTA